MTRVGLDPVIHVPARLEIVATLAALPPGDTLSFTRLQDLIELTPGNLITHLRKLEDVDYVTIDKSGSGPASRTSVALTHRGRAALDFYTETLRGLLDGLQINGDRSGSEEQPVRDPDPEEATDHEEHHR